MFNLDPTKLLIIAVVAVILLGPDKLPQVARQAGAAWRSFNEFRHRMETEVRSSIPDLPSSADIARMARSPSALLNHLSTLSPDEAESNGNGAADGVGADGVASVNGNGNGNGNGTVGEASVNETAGAPISDKTAGTSGDPSGAESHDEHIAAPAAAATPTMPTAPMPSTPPTAAPSPSPSPTPRPGPGPGADVVGDPSLN